MDSSWGGSLDIGAGLEYIMKVRQTETPIKRTISQETLDKIRAKHAQIDEDHSIPRVIAHVSNHHDHARV